jgi:hypothetical protein
MSEQPGPRRLVEGDAAFVEIEDGLGSARTRGPSAEQAARMRAALGLAAAAATLNTDRVSASAADTAPRMPATRLRWRLLVSGVLALGAALGAWRSVSGPHVEPPAPHEAQRPSKIDHAAPVAAPTIAPEITSIPPRAVRSESAPASPHSHRVDLRAAHTAPATDEAPDSLAELALLKRAKADARSEPATALELVAEHERRFPHGVLVEEREVIAIEALIAAGERRAAEARATRFFARFPHSAHARRVHALLADEGAAQSGTSSSASPHPSH